MNKEKTNYREMIFALLQDMKEDTLSKLLEADENYQLHKRESANLTKVYKDMELTDGLRNVIDGILNAKEDENYYYNINTYLAGLIDAAKVVNEFKIDIFSKKTEEL